MNETLKMSEAWRALADRFRKLAAMRADEGTSIQLAYLVLAQHCARECSDVRGPTMEMVALAENTTGENLSDEFTKKAMGVAETTTVDLVIRLQVAGLPADVETYREALESLAEVMAVQAEDGLWSAGYRDGDEPNEHVADITSTHVQAVLIDGCDELLQEVKS